MMSGFCASLMFGLSIHPMIADHTPTKIFRYKLKLESQLDLFFVSVNTLELIFQNSLVEREQQSVFDCCLLSGALDCLLHEGHPGVTCTKELP